MYRLYRIILHIRLNYLYFTIGYTEFLASELALHYIMGYIEFIFKPNYLYLIMDYSIIFMPAGPGLR